MTMRRLSRWIGRRDKRDGEVSGFYNSGTTKRERQVARLLNRWLPVDVVERGQFGPWLGGGIGDALSVSVDLTEGRTVPGGFVKGQISAHERASAIYQVIASRLL
jgi:hypothetical protein